VLFGLLLGNNNLNTGWTLLAILAKVNLGTASLTTA